MIPSRGSSTCLTVQPKNNSDNKKPFKKELDTKEHTLYNSTYIKPTKRDSYSVGLQLESGFRED